MNSGGAAIVENYELTIDYSYALSSWAIGQYELVLVIVPERQVATKSALAHSHFTKSFCALLEIVYTMRIQWLGYCPQS